MQKTHLKLRRYGYMETMENLRKMVDNLGEIAVRFRGVDFFIDRFYVDNLNTHKRECEFPNLDEFMEKGTIGNVPFKDAVQEMDITEAP